MNPIHTQLSLYTLADLKQLKQKIKQEEQKRFEAITTIYGTVFSQIIGKETIFNLPEVSDESLKLKGFGKYPMNIVRPHMLGDKSAVRGVMEYERPFIVIKIEVKYNEQILGIFAEVIFKRYGNIGDGKFGGLQENNYVSSLSLTSDEGVQHPSFLYSSGGMSQMEIENVKQLLDGKEIHLNNHHIRMV